MALHGTIIFNQASYVYLGIRSKGVILSTTFQKFDDVNAGSVTRPTPLSTAFLGAQASSPAPKRSERPPLRAGGNNSGTRASRLLHGIGDAAPPRRWAGRNNSGTRASRLLRG